MRNEDIIKYFYNALEPVLVMKPSLAILILIIGLLSCDSADPFLPLTPGLVEEIKAYDLDNNGNSSDIRVDFEVKDNLNVIEYRIMVLPSSLENAFDEDIASSIASTSYFRIEPENFTVEYSIKRLPPGLLDINGGQIQENIEYLAVVFAVGKDNFELSGYSGYFTLKNQGIYGGRYFIGIEYECQNFPDDRADGSTFIDLTGNEDDYFGTFIRPHIGNQGLVSFSVVGTTVLDYVRDWPDQLCSPQPTCDGFCPVLEQGEGIIIDELNIEIAIISDYCNASCEGTRFFIKQG